MNASQMMSALSLACVVCCAGCSWTTSPTVPARAGGSGGSGSSGGGGGGGGVSATNPFAPVTLRVHPLTRTVNTKGSPVEVVVHLEMRDAWGDTTKGVGAVMVRLVRQKQAGVGVESTASSASDVSQRWDIDLSNLATNAAMFDPATRTYRMQLTGVHAWVAGGAADGSRSRTLIQATLTPPGGAMIAAEALLER